MKINFEDMQKKQHLILYCHSTNGVLLAVGMLSNFSRLRIIMNRIYSIMIIALSLIAFPSQLCADSLSDQLDSNAPPEKITAALEEVLQSGKPYQKEVGSLLDKRGSELSQDLRGRSYQYVRNQWLKEGQSGLRRLYQLSSLDYKQDIMSGLAGSPEEVAASLVMLKQWKDKDQELAKALKASQENYIKALPLKDSLLKNTLAKDSDFGKNPARDSTMIQKIMSRLRGSNSKKDFFSSLSTLKATIDAQGLCNKSLCSLRSTLSPEMKESRLAYLEELQRYQKKKLLTDDKKKRLLSIRTSMIHDCSFSLNTRAGSFYQLVQENSIEVAKEYQKLHEACNDSESQNVLQQAYHSFVTFIDTGKMLKHEKRMILNRLGVIEELIPAETPTTNQESEK